MQLQADEAGEGGAAQAADDALDPASDEYKEAKQELLRKLRKATSKITDAEAQLAEMPQPQACSAATCRPVGYHCGACLL